MSRRSRGRLTNFQKAKQFCPNLPWCQDEPERLGPVITSFIYDQEAFVRRWSQRWFENFQFAYGNSTIKWSKTHDFAVDTDFLSRGNVATNQRAFTNVSRVVIESIGALLYNNLPKWNAETTDESNARGTKIASICESLLDAYMTRLEMEKEFMNAILSFVTYSQCAARIDWNPKSGMSMEIPQYEQKQAPQFTDFLAPNSITGGLFEVPTPALNSMGQPSFGNRWEPQYDETGKQAVVKSRTGDVGIQMLTPFEYRREIGSAGMHKTRYVEHIRLMDYDKYLSEFDDLGGKTRFFNEIMPGFNNKSLWAFAVNHFVRMMFTSPPVLEDGGNGISRLNNTLRGSLFNNKILVVEHFDEPNEEMWPEGRRVVVANGQCTHVTVPQYTTNKMGGWHPFVEAQWMAIPPSSVATGAMDSVTSKNHELNMYDSLIATSARRNMGSQLLVLNSGGFDPNKVTGEPGQHHIVNSLDAAKWLHDDQPIPPAVPSIRESLKQDVWETSGALDATRGDRSKGASSGYAYRVLQEREERRLAPLRRVIEVFASGIGEKIITCLHTNCIKLDENVMGYLARHGSGKFQTNDIISFLSKPIDYGIDLRIEPGSMNAKSRASQQATLMELAKGPGANRIATNAQVLDRFLKFYEGGERLRDDSAFHRDRAERENDLFKELAYVGPDNAGITKPIVLFEDDDMIHTQEHTNFLLQNSDEIMADERYLQAVLLHIETHRLQMQEKQGQLMPGTSLSAPAMMAESRTIPPPNAPVMYNYAREQAMQTAGTPPEQPKPQAAQGPKQETGGPPNKQTPADTPSENTAPANQGGMPGAS